MSETNPSQNAEETAPLFFSPNVPLYGDELTSRVNMILNLNHINNNIYQSTF